ncbi:MAG: hypothetical protein AAGL98_05405 [Planctomycetota bacterium]
MYRILPPPSTHNRITTNPPETSTISRTAPHLDVNLAAPEVTVWTSPARAATAGRILDLMAGAVRPLGVGGPRSAEVERLSQELDCPADNDLRQLLVDRPAAYLLVTSMRDVRIADLRTAVDAGTRVLCLEPAAAEIAEVGAADTPGHPGAIRFFPAFTQSPGLIAAADPAELHHSPSLVRFSSHGRPDEGSLLARLLDGWITTLPFSALPETIDAHLHQPGGPSRRTFKPRAIGGWLTAHGRTADGGAVLLEASDRALVPRRELALLNAAADAQIDDASYRLHPAPPAGPDNDMPPPETGGDPSARPSYADLVANQWRRWIDRPAPPIPPALIAQALACIHACLLSARTGQAESPAKLLRLG